MVIIEMVMTKMDLIKREDKEMGDYMMVAIMYI